MASERSEPGPRRQAREAALQMLYALDCLEAPTESDAEKAIAAYWANLDGPPAGRAYTDAIVRGVAAHRAAIDEALRGASTSWRLERMARVDRNLLRIGLWELSWGREAPPQVVIDEAVELARTFGAEGAYAFVNGLLDKLARAARSP